MKETRFKDTEIGRIPEDWNVVSLKEIGEFTKGQGISRAVANSGSIPAIRYGEIYTTHNDYIKEFRSFISEDVAQYSTALKNGDILFTASGETKEDIGKAVAYLSSDEEAYAGGDIIILSPKVPVDSKYLGFALNTKYSVKQKSSKAQGDAIVHITTDSIASILTPIPPLSEQIRIASALTSIDNLISSLDKLIEKKKAIKEGTMQQLLTGKKRLKGFNEPWVERKLGDIAHNICTGKRNGNEQKPTGKYPFFVRSQQVYRIDTYSFDGEAIIVPGEGGIGTIFHYITGKFDYHQRVYKISDFTNEVNGRFIYYYMKRFFGRYALQNSVKATVDSLRLSSFLNFDVIIPDNKDEQSAIADILSSIDHEILSLEAKRDKYIKTKQGMMQQLLTGRIRLV